MMSRYTLLGLLILISIYRLESQNLERINGQIDSIVNLNQFSGSILQSINDEVVYNKSFGKADYSNNLDNTLQTQFNIGSINKLLTKIIFAKLLQDNLVKLSDLAYKWIPELDDIEMGNKITIGQLLGMSSGLGDYLESDKYLSNKSNFKDQNSFRSLLANQKLNFVPGTSKQYSNLGYELLGLIVEEITHKSFFQVLQDFVLGPSNMTKTIFLESSSSPNDIAIGYYEEGGSLIPNHDIKPFASTAAGGAYSNVLDLCKLGTALFELKLLNEEYTSLLFKNFNPKSRKKGSYVFVAGSGPGINATLYLNRKRKEVVVVLSNFSSPSAKRINDIFKENSINNKVKK